MPLSKVDRQSIVKEGVYTVVVACKLSCVKEIGMSYLETMMIKGLIFSSKIRYTTYTTAVCTSAFPALGTVYLVAAVI